MKRKCTAISITLAALVLVSLFAVISTASVSGQTMTGTGPAACTAWASPPSLTYVFATASSGSVWFTTTNGAWQSIGGVSTSSPAATSWATVPYSGTQSLRLDVFVRGADGSLMHKYYQNGWSSWQSLGGKLAAGTGPAVCSWSAGRLDVFVTGTDGILYHKWYANGAWSGWQSLGGKLTSSPTAAVPINAKQIDVFVRGTDSALWWQQWNGNAWTGWRSLGGRIAPYTGPAVNFFSYRLFVQGVNPTQLWALEKGTDWAYSSWRTLAGAPPEALSTSSPGATNIPANDHTWVGVTTVSGNVWESAESLTNYQHWYPMGSPP